MERSYPPMCWIVAAEAEIGQRDQRGGENEAYRAGQGARQPGDMPTQQCGEQSHIGPGRGPAQR